jgi:hypothetical protein
MDFNWYGIPLMKKLGLASRVRCAEVHTQRRENEIRPSEPMNALVSV